MPNLTFEPDAGNYTFSQAVERFVPTITWGKVRRPANQLLYGCAGSGKTMLLKRLSWPAMLAAPAFETREEFIAFYCDVRELEILGALFDPHLRAKSSDHLKPESHARFLAVTHILHSIGENLRDASPLAQSGIHQALVGSLLKVIELVLFPLAPSAANSLAEILTYLGDLKSKLVATINVPHTPDGLVPIDDNVPSPEQTVRAFISAFAAFGYKTHVGLLLDQYDSLPRECQALLNPLLKRENRPNLFTIVACRPFAFDLRAGKSNIQPGEDFSFTILEYFPSDKRDFLELLEDIWAGIRPEGPSLARILEGGPGLFAELSSRSIRRFLELCESCGALGASISDIMRRKDQLRAAERISSIFRDQLKIASDVEFGSIWDLVLKISEGGRTKDNIRQVPYQVHIKADSLFLLESLSDSGAILIKRAFGEGVIQFMAESEGCSFSLPSRFALAPIVGPVLGGTIDPALTTSLGIRDIEMISHGRPKTRPRRDAGVIGELERVFLSTSFADLPDPQQARQMFSRVFEAEGVKTVEGSGLGPGAIQQILEQIRTSDLSLVDITHLRPNVILELGLSLGMRHRIVPVLNRDSKRATDLGAYPFLAAMGYLPYDFSSKSLKELLRKVREWSAKPIDESHLLERTLDGGTRLRVAQRKRHLALYYPAARRRLWESMLHRMKRAIAEKGFTLLDVQHSPHPQRLDVFDNLVWAASAADRIIIDTSGETEPDLYGSFAIGFGFAQAQGDKGKYILRIEETGENHESGLSMWPSTYYQAWSNEDDAVRLLTEFLPNRRPATRRRK